MTNEKGEKVMSWKAEKEDGGNVNVWKPGELPRGSYNATYYDGTNFLAKVSFGVE